MENKLIQIKSQTSLLEYCKSVKEPTVEAVINSQAGSLRLIKERLGEQVAEAMVVYFITDLVGYFNLTRPMNSLQIAETVEIVIKKFPHFTPEDFSRCFFNIKSLRYGKLFEGIDGAKITEFMEAYDAEFLQEEQEYYRKKVEQKRSEIVDWDDKVLSTVKTAVEKLSVKKEEPKPIEPRKRTQQELLVESWHKEFDKLYELQGYPKGVQRMVEYKKKHYCISEFIEIKFEEFLESEQK